MYNELASGFPYCRSGATIFTTVVLSWVGMETEDACGDIYHC